LLHDPLESLLSPTPK